MPRSESGWSTRAFPDDDIVIAVLINREELAEPDDSAKNIASAIGAMIA
ncbi:MAG TPA: hypothetical protein VFC19_21645 [Candidatus Limnocylindrales bacterium]|nr:hypothetical protein [Candidatus Limnocylindrales bacterium]